MPVNKSLTVAKVDKLRRAAAADPSKQAMQADPGQRGLYVRTRQGKVDYLFLYTSPATGKRRRLGIGSAADLPLEAARKVAADLRREVTLGRDPLEQKAEQQVERAAKEANGATVADAIAKYLEEYEGRVENGHAATNKRAGNKRSGLESARRRLESLPSSLLRRPLAGLTVEHVNRWMDGKSATPSEANRALSALRTALGAALDRGMGGMTRNPAADPTVLSYRETGARRKLTDAELARLGKALADPEREGTEHPSVLLCIRLLALTGLRRGELIGAGGKVMRGEREGLRWGDVDMGTGIVTLPTSKTGRSVRVIGRAAIDLLEGVRPADAQDEDPVVPGERAGQPLVGIDNPRRRLWQAAGIKATPAGRVDLHSLRHTFASIGAGLDFGRWIGHVSRLLGHGYQGRSVTERYISDSPSALRPAADAIAGEIARLLGLEAGPG